MKPRIRILKGMCELAIGSFLFLLGLRMLAEPPRASDPPEMHAFYRAWLQPSCWLILAPLLFAVVAPLLVAFTHVAWHRWRRRRELSNDADAPRVRERE